MTDMHAVGAAAKRASRAMAKAPTHSKDLALRLLADGIGACAEAVLAANARDVAGAVAAGKPAAYVDRMTLNPKRLDALAQDVRAVADLRDPVGEVFDAAALPNGLRLHKRRAPLGVLGVIFESRPNVTTDIASLAIKSGNACILRGGSDTLATNRALVGIVHDALSAAGLPRDAVCFVDDADRARINELLKLNACVDLIIPRGGAALHQMCRDNSTIPVITGGMGINHLYVDPSADVGQAVEIAFNAKTHKPSACNSLGTLLVHAATAGEVLPRVAARLGDAGVAFRCDERALAILTGNGRADVAPAGPDDWDTEWLALVCGVKVVDSLDEALAFIERHSMGHSDAICARDAAAIARFLNEVDSAAVFANASMRFNDGGQFGLGAEVAISTQRVHARGPMGLRELTTYKWVVEGDGQVRP